jgi:putative acetyltransferase
MEIRRADINDIDEIRKLYYDTVVTVNAKDYSKEQIQAWASTAGNGPGWIRRIEEQYFYVALINSKIVGFGSLDNSGYLDLLYVHKDYQKKGIGSSLLQELEKTANELELTEINVQASITAKPFFETNGFTLTGEKHKLVEDVAFTNSIMVKKIKQLA